jgi:murein endopeptidase
MVGMLDWLGREMVAEQEQSLLVGDISAPRGGCLSGRGGRRGHLSHTSGLDVDIGFIFTHKRAPATFTKDFEAEPNWLMLKKIFQNPFACVKMVLLDRKWISKMNRVAVNDPYWPEIRRFVKHAKHHKNHFHVRVGELPGAPGCNQPFEPVIDEDEGEGDGGEDAATSRSELAQKIEQEVDEDPPLDENTLEIDTDDLASQMARPIPARIIPSGERMGPRATQ